MDIEKVSDLDNLYKAFKEACKESKWKASVQKYDIDLLLNLVHTKDSLLDGTYKQRNFYEFTLNERGKVRRIKSLHVSDRVVQRSLCDEMLISRLYKYLTYDNGASVKNKGISFARDRLNVHLQKYYRKHGSDGYVLLIDFRKFFDNIQHDKLLATLTPLFDDSICSLLMELIDSFKIDVSYMTDEEFANCMNLIYDSLSFPYGNSGEKFMRKSVGIGSQISQVAGVYYPTRIDNFCKIVKGIKYYGRYMDDIYIIHHDKEYLKALLTDIKNIANELGLFINENKTHIVKLTHGFTFLKIQYRLLPSGHIVKRLSRSSITRERRRLKKYRKLVDNNRITFEEVFNAYQSWLGNAKQFDSYNTIQNMNRLFNSLFKEELCLEKK